MPIRAYFLFIGPALLAFLWFVGWYMEPPRPAQPAVAARSTITKVPGQKAQTVGVAPSPAAAELPVAATTATAATTVTAATTPALASPPLPDISASNEAKPADDVKP